MPIRASASRAPSPASTPYLDERTRTRMTEITLTHPPMLLPAMFARVKLVKEVIPDAITVPAYSLVAAPGGGYLAFVVEEGKAARRTVETGIEVEGRVHILGGLAAGDRLIVGGQEKLKDGAAVKAVELDGKKVGGEGAEPEAQAKPGSEGPT